MTFNNKFFRIYAVTTDGHGVDPLMDKVVPKLMNITSYDIHEVTQDERGAPDLISYRRYGTEDYWWHILSYNGICSFRDVVQGITLKIPDIGSIIAITNQVMVENNAQSGASRVAII